MIHANPDFTEADHRKLHAGGVRGVRFNCVERNWRLRSTRRVSSTSWRGSQPLGWAVDLHIEADFLEPHAEMIRRVPLPVVIDHFANVHSTGGKDRAIQDAAATCSARSTSGSRSAAPTGSLSRGARYEDVVPLARALIARAPDRIIWGTDWPHSNIFKHGEMPNDGDLMNMMLDFAPDEAVRRKILVDNPARLFGFA